MRLRIAVLVVKILLWLGSLVFLAAGIFAVPLGLDNDPGWGRGRILLVIAGALLCLAAIVGQWFPVIRERYTIVAAAALKKKSNFQDSAFNQSLQRAFAPVWAWFGRNPAFQKLRTFWQNRDGFFAAAGVITALLVAVWFFTTGRLTTWSPGTDYFNRLADGFLAGQLSMLDEPSPELLAMPNPYNWQARIEDQIPFLWDATFYDGKYYLYWGPVPALIAVGVKIIHPGHIFDGALLLSFYAGIVILQALILRYVRCQFFPATPAWLLTPLILMAGLSLPVLYLVIHPNVYETAISSGQFFLLGGFYCLLRVLAGHPRSGGWLVAAGFSFGAAVGSRMTLVFAVGFFVLLFGVYILKTRLLKPTLGALTLLGAPLALWAIGLGWYNWARFDSVFETGWRYQLTGPALPSSQGSFFSLDYFLPNLYSYFIQLPIFTPGAFPFMAIPFRSETTWPWFLQPPANYYYPEPIASILVLVPAVWLIGLPVVGWLRKAFYWIHERPYRKRKPTLAYKTVWAALLGASGMLLLPLTLFTSSSLRYLADVLPFWSLLTAFSLWWGLDFLEHRPGLKRLLILLALILLTAGVFFGFFGNFITGDNLFENRNLELYRKLGQFFQ